MSAHTPAEYRLFGFLETQLTKTRLKTCFILKILKSWQSGFKQKVEQISQFSRWHGCCSLERAYPKHEENFPEKNFMIETDYVFLDTNILIYAHSRDDEQKFKIGKAAELAGKKLKAKNGWNYYIGKSGTGDDVFGFSSLPGGYGSSYGDFYTVGDGR
jgi:hypothetical protein